MDSPRSSDNKVVQLEGKLCILGYELPVDEDLLEEGGKSGSNTLDDLFDCNVPYSVALLSCVPAFYRGEIDFNTVIEHILGALYKHPPQWSQLKKAIASDEGYVTLYICPFSGVPMIIPSDQVYQIHVNDLTVNMRGTSLSRLCKLTHLDVLPEASEKCLEELKEIGFIGDLIDDMDAFITYLFGFVAGKGDEEFVEFMQELLHEQEVYLEINLETGGLLVESVLEDDDEIGGEETLQELLSDIDDDEIEENEAHESEAYQEIPDWSSRLKDEEAVLEALQNDKQLIVKREDLSNPDSIFIEATKTLH